jgi:RHS repeat-associated protein
VEIWYYDAVPVEGAVAGWRLAGTGTVSTDGRRVVSDPGAGLERFCGVCGAVCINNKAAGQENANPDGAHDGDPVNLATGLMLVQATDLVIPGRISAVIHRTYSPRNPFGGVAGFELSTGPGWALSIDPVLLEDGASVRRLILPGNARFAFARRADGTFVNTSHPRFAGAVLSVDGTTGHVLRYANGNTWRFLAGWIPRGRGLPIPGLSLLVEQRDRAGNVLTVTRDSTGAPTRITDPGGRALDLTVTPLDALTVRVTAIRDPLGRTVTYEYDTTTRRLSAVTNAAGGITRYSYDAAGQILTMTDARGNVVTTNDYDASGRVTRQTQADGGVWQFAYAGPAKAATGVVVTNPRGLSTTRDLATSGYASKIVDPLGRFTRFEADATGQPTVTTDSLGRSVQYQYDAAGNMVRSTDAGGHVRTFTYDPVFNLVMSATSPVGNTTSVERDAFGDIIARIDPTGARATIGRSTAGEPLTITDPVGNTRSFTYDAYGNLTSLTDGAGHTLTRTYDIVGRFVTQTNARGALTRFAYDDLNRIAQIIDAMGGVTRFTYDANGNLLTVTDPLGRTLTHTYDTMNRLASRTDRLGATETFAYDGTGNLIRHVDRKGQLTEHTYDPIGRLVVSRYADGSVKTNTFDAAGRRVETLDTAGGLLRFEYDTVDRLVAEISDGGAVRYTYDGAGRRLTLSAPDQAPTSYAYDKASRLVRVEQGGQIVGLEYDTAGRRTRLLLPNGVSVEHAYDAASRVRATTYRNAMGVLGDLVYAYDATGNRTEVGGSLATVELPGEIETATYDAADRQVTFGSRTMTYDANGNVATITEPGGTTVLAWDARDRLVGMTAPGLIAAFAYDGLGRRTSKRVNDVLMAYLYDGRDVLQELAPATVTRHLRGAMTIDETFAFTNASGTFVPLHDAIGSARALTDATGAAVETYRAEPFGAQTGMSAAGYRFLHTGREVDDTGLHYFRSRYYHPGLHRFLSEDAWGLASQRTNFYAFVRNNPATLNDPFGWFSPEGHALATQQAFANIGGFSPNDIAQVVGANVAMDSNPISWVNPNDPKHYMPGTDAKAQQFIQEKLAEAIALKQIDRDAALRALGQATHTAQDRYAHADRDPQGTIGEHGRGRLGRWLRKFDLPDFGLPLDPDDPDENPEQF